MIVGVIGLGSMGMRHARNLTDLGFSVRAFDLDMRRRLAFNGVLWSLEEVLESGAIVIATPTEIHEEDLGLCAERDVPILVEKPISTFPAPHLVRSNTWVGYNLRYHGAVTWVRMCLPKIGRPLWANFTCAQFNEKPAYLRDGVILNWSHEIDLALHLLGGAAVLGASTRLTECCDDLTDIILGHTNGCRTTIHLDYLTTPEVRGFTIAGTDGVIEANLVTRECALRTKMQSTDYQATDTWDDNYKDEIRDFLGERYLLCSSYHAVKVLEICAKVREMAGL